MRFDEIRSIVDHLLQFPLRLLDLPDAEVQRPDLVAGGEPPRSNLESTIQEPQSVVEVLVLTRQDAKIKIRAEVVRVDFQLALELLGSGVRTAGLQKRLGVNRISGSYFGVEFYGASKIVKRD